MNEMQIATMATKEALKFLKDLMMFSVNKVIDVTKDISKEATKGINKIADNIKTERGNKSGEVSIEKLEKNHGDKVVYKNLDENNLDKFKEAAKINNLQYAVVKQPDNTVNIHYAERHSNKMEATMDTTVRSAAIEKQEKAIVDKELKELIQDLRKEVAELRKENQELKQELADLRRNDPLKEVKELIPHIKDDKDKAIVKEMGKESLDKLVNGAVEKSKNQEIKAPVKEKSIER